MFKRHKFATIILTRIRRHTMRGIRQSRKIQFVCQIVIKKIHEFLTFLTHVSSLYKNTCTS